jgi:Fe2+ transport system protein FeoA
MSDAPTDPRPPTSLAAVPVGARARVARVNATGELRRRLLDLGVLPGEEVVVEAIAPVGGPVEITVKGYRLSLRKTEAETVVVELAG